MGSTIVMAPTLPHSHHPLSPSELLGTTDSLSASTLRQSSGSGSARSSAGNNGTGNPKAPLSGVVELDFPSFNSDFKLDTSVFANGKEIRPVSQPNPSPQPEVSAGATTTEAKLLRRASTARSRKSLLIERPRSWLMSSSKSAKDLPNTNDETRLKPNSVAVTAPSTKGTAYSSSPSSRRQLGGSSESFANFARRSWISRSSRSPSPKHALDQTAVDQPASARRAHEAQALGRTSNLRASISPHQLRNNKTNDMPETGQIQHPESSKPTTRPLTKATSYLSKIKGRQQSSYLGRDGAESDHSFDSSVTSLNWTPNSIRTSASQSICSDGNTNTPITDESCNEMSPKLRDPLWSAFKTLENETKAFGSKQTAHRVAQVHSILLPFLRSTRDHPSAKVIALEDVERRAIILNKWWMALLDMLHGQLQQPIPGMDRPLLLEAATMLMMRPEWRQATTYMQPLGERSPSERVRSRSWTNASKSTTDSSIHSDMFAAESAEHNVRTMFVTNLVKQMAYVVDKMSMRHAPLSLVNFSGKTCAYAFFFVPGVADVLLRLWGLTPELIKQAGAAFGLPRRDGGESDDIIALFPPKLGPLGWSSPRTMWDMLKKVPKMPLLVARVPWTGPWVARWKGRDTDLFFIFCKYFHVLLDQFVPPGLPLTEKARSPAFALVHAQLLSVVDSTIHRQTGMELAAYAPLIDSVNGSDSAPPLPLPPNNLAKPMNENRLVILLQDFLSDNAPEITGAKHTFAEAFAAIIKAAASKTSLYDTAACFTLCDFLEEVLMIYHEFETPSVTVGYIDWSFWIEVCKRMASSMNTMSEVRMLSFVFTIWDAVAKDSRKKAMICLEWLLTEETFDFFFNNWCPMVRAYYQRLICWRMCRYTGGSNEMDVNIYLTAAARLKTHWAHYLYLKQTADELGKALPSSAPMSPAMGKKFMIIRQEATTPNAGLFMGFDTFARATSNQPLMLGNDITPDTSRLGRGDTKKRWSLLGKVLAITSGGAVQPAAMDEDEIMPGSARSDTLGRRRLADPASLITPPSKSGSIKAPASEDGSLGSSPVYDEQKYIFKFVLGWQHNPSPARDRVLTRPRLPLATQARISVKGRGVQATTATALAPASPPPPATAHADGTAQSPPETPKPALGPKEDDVASLTSSVEEWLRNTPTSSSGFDSNSRRGSIPESRVGTPAETICNASPRGMKSGGESNKEQLTRPVKPTGLFAKNAVYCGRALAEWAQVVSECNIFTERRQDDGVERLVDIEVPLLNVDGFRR